MRDLKVDGVHGGEGGRERERRKKNRKEERGRRKKKVLDPSPPARFPATSGREISTKTFVSPPYQFSNLYIVVCHESNGRKLEVFGGFSQIPAKWSTF